MEIPRSHPRYKSLTTRERLVELFQGGVVAGAGLIAHGRGEAFDYLLGEATPPMGLVAERVAAAQLILAENPVLSVNGNVAALDAEGMVKLAKSIPAKIEVNLFHRTEERMRAVVKLMEENGAEGVLGLEPDREIPGLDHARAKATDEGIYSADVVLVPLEDGDRARALVEMGKVVICIDLNPLSRTSKVSTVSIVDELTRALENMLAFVQEMRGDKELCRELVDNFDNHTNLGEVAGFISQRIDEEFKRTREE